MKALIVIALLTSSPFANAFTGEQLNECLYNNESGIQTAATLIHQLSAEGYLNELEVFELAAAPEVTSCQDAKLVLIQEYAKGLAKKNAATNN